MNSLKLGLAATLLAGCFPHPSEQYTCSDTETCTGGRSCVQGYCVVPDDGGAGSDGTPGGDAEDPCRSFGSRHFDACAIPRPTGPMTLSSVGVYIFDTTTGSLLDPANVMSTPPSMVVGELRVISVDSFSLVQGATLRVNGTHPLVIASWGTLEVSGTIDLSTTNLTRGAGAALASTCAAHVATAGQNGNGGGGGGGGSLQSAGGNGGSGGNNAADGGNGGTAVGTAPLLAGGCSGEKGGNDGGNTGGNGGVGGGAVQLTAKISISIAATGRIHAGGAGGRPGPGASGGGGGGGAGGMIGLEAPALTITPGAILAANGGGGGQGGGNAGGTPQAGQDGQLSATAANGGTAGSGGDGGKGSVSTTAGLAGGNDGAGGGAGGGGAGYITVKAATRNDSGATFSPPATTIQ